LLLGLEKIILRLYLASCLWEVNVDLGYVLGIGLYHHSLPLDDLLLGEHVRRSLQQGADGVLYVASRWMLKRLAAWT